MINDFRFLLDHHLRVAFDGKELTEVAESNIAVKYGVAEVPLWALAELQSEDSSGSSMTPDGMLSTMEQLLFLVLEGDSACRRGLARRTSAGVATRVERGEFALIGDLGLAQQQSRAARVAGRALAL